MNLNLSRYSAILRHLIGWSIIICSSSSNIFISAIFEDNSSFPSLKKLLLKVSLGECGDLGERGEIEVLDVKLTDASLILLVDTRFYF